MKILFICSGNTCRSPMAEALMRRELENSGLTGVEASSAGACIWPDDIASRDTVAEMKQYGIDLTGRRAVQVTLKLLDENDLVLAMTRGVANYVKDMLPLEDQSKVMSLGDYLGTGEDVDDPYGCGSEVYHAVALQLERMVKAAAEKIAADMQNQKSR